MSGLLKAGSSSLKAGPSQMNAAVGGSSLKAGPTGMGKSKVTSTGSKGITGGVTKFGGAGGGYRGRAANKSNIKTTTTDKDDELVKFNDAVANPKKLITADFKDNAKAYLAAMQEHMDKSSSRGTQGLPKASTSVIDSSMKSPQQSMDQEKSSGSDVKMSSSNMQEKNSFMESKRSENTENSEDDSSKDKAVKETKKKKGKKTLTETELEETITINIDLFKGKNYDSIPSALKSPSSIVSQESSMHAQSHKMNIKYEELLKVKEGSDNFTERSAQTFNYQPKQKEQQSNRIEKSDVGTFATVWDLYDTGLQEIQTEFEVLQIEIKKNIDKEMQEKVKNPFCLIPYDIRTIRRHVEAEIPGAAQTELKEEKKGARGARHAPGGTATNPGISGIGVSMTNTQTVNPDRDDSIKDSSSSVTNSKIQKNPTNTHNNMTNTNTAKQGKGGASDKTKIGAPQQPIETSENIQLKEAIKEAQNMMGENEAKIMNSEYLMTSLKYVDRLLNQNTYHKQYILYRNYPEIKIERSIADDDQGKRMGGYRGYTTRMKMKEHDEENENEAAEENKEASPLKFLFKYNCDLTKDRTVSCADWNPVNKDLLAITYGEFDLNVNREGYIMFWTLKNPSFPERIIKYPSRIISCKYSESNPCLIAAGTYDGIVAIYDVRKKGNQPIAENREMEGKHSDAVWEVQWVGKGAKNEKGESLVSISSDGRIVEWSMKKGLECQEIMSLKKQSPSSQKDNVNEGISFRQAAGFSFNFIKGESSMYLAATEEGSVHRCSKSYPDTYLENYYGHTGPIYKVRGNPFWSDIFLTCSADWSCKLWNWRDENSLNTFQSIDLFDEVMDIEWSPHCSTLFANVSRDGRLELWDLKKSMLDPFTYDKPKEGEFYPAKTMVRFGIGGPVVITGDVMGDTNLYRLMGYEDNDPKLQQDQLIKLLYPTGYTKGNKEADDINF